MKILRKLARKRIPKPKKSEREILEGADGLDQGREKIKKKIKHAKYKDFLSTLTVDPLLDVQGYLSAGYGHNRRYSPLGDYKRINIVSENLCGRLPTVVV